jgi:Ankyrin repeats (3 copies)
MLVPAMTLGRSCGAMLAGWLVLVGGYYYVAVRAIHEPMPAVLIAVLGGTFAGMLLSSFFGLFTGRRDRSALRRAITAAAPRDGHIEAASGPIRPTGAPLEAPFSGRPCVAYEYDVKPDGEGQSDYAGVALAPSAIETLRGPARVLGWSVLDAFPYTDQQQIDRQRGAAYLKSAAFEPLGLTTMLSALTDLVADDDGTVRKDFRVAGEAAALEGRRITERIIPVGEVVTILGRWSDARGGFAPTGAGSMNRLFPGDLTNIRRRLGGDALKTFGIAVFFFVALHSILVPILVLAPRGGTSGSTPPSVWDERDCAAQKKLLAEGADPNERGVSGTTALMNAARMDEPACVQQLIAAGARLETRDENGDTALAQAILVGRDENVALLLRAGAKDFRVTEENGEPVETGAPPLVAVQDYIAAVHRGDFEAMARLMFGVSVARLQEQRDNLQLWRSLRPKDPQLVKGWMTDRAATILIKGATPSGEQRINYHLENDGQAWRIRREWFLDH